MSSRFTGNAGCGYLFDFGSPKARRHPVRIVQTINRPNRDTAQTVVLAWADTKDVRPRDARACALRNPAEQSLSSAEIKAVRSYEVRPAAWSQREGSRKVLAA